MKAYLFSILFIVCTLPAICQIEVKVPPVIMEGEEYTADIVVHNADTGIVKVQVKNHVQILNLKEGKTSFSHKSLEKEEIIVHHMEEEVHTSVQPIPLWMSIIPPLVAIFIALLFKEVISALFLGLFSGTLIMYFYNSGVSVYSFGASLFAVVDNYIANSLANRDHVLVILFSMLIGGVVHIISKNGGMSGAVSKISQYAKTKRSGQLVVWVLGILIFFDDYANSLIVGNTMRPITDKLKISREKLAYLVDSTAAPIASLALITTWIGIELSYIQEGIDVIGLNDSAYVVFIKSLSTRFYPIYTLIFILLITWKGKDFGAMLKAERNLDLSIANAHVHTSPEEKFVEETPPKKQHWYNALIPIIIIILGTMAGLFYTGYSEEVWGNAELPFFKKISEIIGASDSYLALLWASLLAVISAIVLSVSQRLLSYRKSINSMVLGFKTMLVPVLILIFAWGLAQMTKDMHTANFISGALIDAHIPMYVLPTVTFVLSGLIAFATGSSWGTMAILYPLMLPALWSLGASNGMAESEIIPIFYNAVSAILAGAVMGDHCSPISDTTILSSLASSCNHISHVKTQMPYALTVGAVSILLGYLPAALGVSTLILYPLGILAMYGIIMVLGKNSG